MSSPEPDERPDRQEPGPERGHSERPKGPLVRECTPPYRRTSGQLAAVVLYRDGGHVVEWPDRRENHRRQWLSRPYTVFEVLLGRNVTEFDLRLPAAGDSVFFDASAKVHWEVADPYLVVTQRVWDVAELLHDDLLDGLRAISRRFALTEAQRADEAVRDELSAGRLSLGRDLGLRTRVHVFVDLSKAVQRKVRRRHEIDLEMAADERKAERERRKDQHERGLVAERARELEVLLLRGEEAEIAHHMAQNPDKQWAIRDALRQEKREGQADFLALFNRLIDTGVLERHDIGEQMYEVLQYLRRSTGGVLGGVAERVLPQPAGGRPELEERSAPRPPAEPRRPEPRRPSWESDEGLGAEGDPERRHVYEPTRVEPASERDFERDFDRDFDRDFERSRNSAPGGRSRPSEAFDDWDDE
ncbi:hypothetical protein QCN29_32900 [Streptomyces sp. HNM0663]|uniref:Uncharacterized protein n=1 Tax=Streptomyces chengmaiensis TaxID=3040919 RepID=A0ABT6HYQ9_9ACTN|nr:hypothetical protein [Streptomyces chengmaiensis]MDH2393481.1 hypothetical protein [Streptomyces chengmaiensis]